MPKCLINLLTGHKFMATESVSIGESRIDLWESQQEEVQLFPLWAAGSMA